MKTTAAESMQSVVAIIAPVLNRAGFRKRRHAFNRSLKDDMTHVLDFQMARFDPPGTRELPPFRVDLYGRFTVNLGVYVPEMLVDPGLAPKGWVHEATCQLRKRLGTLLPSGLDASWSLDDPIDAADVVGSAISSVGLPWLDEFTSRDSVVEAYRTRGGDALGMAPRAPLEIGFLLLQGDRPHAEAILRDYLATDLSPPHRKWTEAILISKGLSALIPSTT
jgi:hypothetical protein